MSLELEACFFVDTLPEIAYRDGLFHIARQIGGYRFECVMRPSVFMESIALSTAAAKLHFAKGAEILPFRREFDEAEVA